LQQKNSRRNGSSVSKKHLRVTADCAEFRLVVAAAIATATVAAALDQGILVGVIPVVNAAVRTRAEIHRRGATAVAAVAAASAVTRTPFARAVAAPATAAIATAVAVVVAPASAAAARRRCKQVVKRVRYRRAGVAARTGMARMTGVTLIAHS